MDGHDSSWGDRDHGGTTVFEGKRLDGLFIQITAERFGDGTVQTKTVADLMVRGVP